MSTPPDAAGGAQHLSHGRNHPDRLVLGSRGPLRRVDALAVDEDGVGEGPAYVDPEQHGSLKSRQEVEAERLKRINASTFFLPQQLVANDQDQTVAVRGRLRTQVNGQETATDTKAYLAEFQYVGGRVHLKAFKEISQ